MRLRNVRTPGEGGAGGRQNFVGESLLRERSSVGPNGRGTRCPSAIEQSSVFNRHIAFVDCAVDRNLQRSYLIDFGCAAISVGLRSLRSVRARVSRCSFDQALDAHFTAADALSYARSAAPGASPAQPPSRPHLTDTTARPRAAHPRQRTRDLRSITFARGLSPSRSRKSGVSRATSWQAAQSTWTRSLHPRSSIRAKYKVAFRLPFLECSMVLADRVNRDLARREAQSALCGY